MGGLLPKPETTKHAEDGVSKSGKWSWGVSEMQGWRPGMEDAHLALPDFDPEQKLGLFGVFDGHGGAAVAKVAAERFPRMFRERPAFKEGRFDVALSETFLHLDEYLDSPEGRKEIAAVVAASPGNTESNEEGE